MSMFCFQCQETARNTGCTVKGVCGKDERASNLMDLLIYTLQGIALNAENSQKPLDRACGVFLIQALFTTITNANFDEDRIVAMIQKGLKIRDALKNMSLGGGGCRCAERLHGSQTWSANTKEEMLKAAATVSPLSYSAQDDIRSLKALLLYGLKGIAAYSDHAAMLNA